MRLKKVQVFPREYGGKIVFELPAMQGGGPFFGCVDGTDLNGHP